jgi:hypothetical protein
MNSPASWDSNSMHDAALFTILNMSVIPAARQYLREEDAVHILSLIADYRKPRSSNGSVIAGVPSTPMHDNDPTIHSELKQQQLQSLKAVRYETYCPTFHEYKLSLCLSLMKNLFELS